MWVLSCVLWVFLKYVDESLLVNLFFLYYDVWYENVKVEVFCDKFYV